MKKCCNQPDTEQQLQLSELAKHGEKHHCGCGQKKTKAVESGPDTASPSLLGTENTEVGKGCCDH